MSRRLCRKCVLPETALNVVFDKDGICNHCRTYEKTGLSLQDYATRQPLLRQRFEAVKGHHRYDALVGLSGGKDSSYTAFCLARDHGLRMLLCTYDNGYLTDSAKNNIRHMVKRLGHDHLFVGPGHELQSAIARASLRRFGLPCVGCTFPGFLAVIKVAVDHNIPFIVHGRSPAQMFKELAPGSTDPFLPFLLSNFKPRQEENVRTFIEASTHKLLARFRWFGWAA